MQNPRRSGPSLNAPDRRAENGLRAQLGLGASELAEVLPDLRELYPDLPRPTVRDPEAARFRLFDAVAGFLRAAAESQPIALVLDDVHAAGGPWVWTVGRGDPYLLPLLEEAERALPVADTPLRVRVLARLAGGPLKGTRAASGGMR